MKSVTIDQLDLKDHVRWAQDQIDYDPIFSDRNTLPHAEIAGISSIYSSKTEELFELQKRNQHWAAFSVPEEVNLFNKSLFSYSLFPYITIGNEREEEEEEQDESQGNRQNLVQLVRDIQNFTPQSNRFFEKDKTAILNLLDSIGWVNQLLVQIHGRKMQYQKG